MTNTERSAILAEVTTIADQAGRYEGDATTRDTSLAFSLIRALAQDVAALSEPREVTLHGYACRDGCGATVKGTI